MKLLELVLNAGGAAVIVIADYLIVVSDCIIAGRVLGETHLAAMNLLMPAFSLVSFAVWFVVYGVSEAYARAYCRGRHEDAARLAGQGFSAVVFVAGLLVALGLVLDGPYYSLLGAGTEFRPLVDAFWSWYQLVVPLQLLYMLLGYLVYKRGHEIFLIVSYAVLVVVNAAGSYWLAERFDIAGLSLGTAIALVVAILILLPRASFLLSPTSLRAFFSWRDLVRPLSKSFGQTAGWLFQSVLFFAIVRYVLVRWDAESLADCAVVFCVIRLTGLFGGIAFALRPLEARLAATGGTARLHRLYSLGIVGSLALMVSALAILFIAPELAAGLFGIVSGDLLEGARFAVRVTVGGLAACGAVAYLPLYFLAREGRCPQAPPNYLQGYILDRVESDPTSRVFNLAKLFRVRQGVDLKRLAQALTASAQSHAALWSTFCQAADGQIVQRKKLPFSSFRFPIHRTTEEALFADLGSIVKTFNAFGGRLFDAAIYDCGERAYLLSNFHHLVCDGYSFPVILEDAHRAFKGETLEPDAYYDVLARHAEKSSTPFAEASRTVLRETLRAKSYVTLPPSDVSGPPGYGAEEFAIALPDGFDAFLAQRRVTRHHVFLAATVLALRKVTGASDILVDWVFHGRLSKEELKTVGAFMVDLPLVVDGDEDFSNEQLLAHVKRATFHGIKNVNVIRDVSDCNPDGQERLTFIYQDEWGELMSPGPVRADGPYAWMIEETIPLGPPSVATENPFNVEIMEHRDSTRLFVEYDTGRYSVDSVRRYAEAFRTALSEICCQGPEAG